MKRSLPFFLVIFCFALSLTPLHAKDREWQTGLLIDVQSQNIGRLYQGTTLRHDTWEYSIDDGKYVWVLQRELHLRGDKPLFVTVNAPVKFVIDKHDAYLLDDDGKEHKLSLLSKMLKKSP